MVSGKDNQTAIMLNLLSAVEEGDVITQRRLAADLGIALGLVNTYLKRCVRKGWVKISNVPMHRYSYYLTPQGFAEKARLTSEYLGASLSFFRHAREDATKLLSRGKSSGWTRFVFVGGGDLAEVAVLSATECGVKIIAVFDQNASTAQCGGHPIVRSIEDLKEVAGIDGIDAVLLTATDRPHEELLRAREIVAYFGHAGGDRVLIPELLGSLRVAKPETGEGS